MHNREFIDRKHFHPRQSCHDQPPLRSKFTNPKTQSPAYIAMAAQTVAENAVSPLVHSPLVHSCRWFTPRWFTHAAFDARTIPESYIFLRDVQCVPYGVQYKAAMGIADYVSVSSPAAILENDGVLVTGSTVLDAFDRLEVLESTAEAVINSRVIGNVAPMPDAAIEELKAAFLE